MVVYDTLANRVLWSTTNRRTCQSNDFTVTVPQVLSQTTVITQITGKSCNNASSTLSSLESQLNKVTCYLILLLILMYTDRHTHVTWSIHSAVHYERTSSVTPILTQAVPISMLAIYKKNVNSVVLQTRMELLQWCWSAANIWGLKPLSRTMVKDCLHKLVLLFCVVRSPCGIEHMINTYRSLEVITLLNALRSPE